jgi:uncharacterized protein GlcG (DUF336 family)
MVTLADARRIIAAAENEVHNQKQPNIAVADAGGNLVAHVRMDGAWTGATVRWPALSASAVDRASSITPSPKQERQHSSFGIRAGGARARTEDVKSPE